MTNLYNECDWPDFCECARCRKADELAERFWWVPAVVKVFLTIAFTIVVFTLITGCSRGPEKRVQITLAWCKTDEERKLFSQCVGRGTSGDELDVYAVHEVEDACRRASCAERSVVCLSNTERFARDNAATSCYLKE